MGVERSFKDYILKFFKHLSLIFVSLVCVLPVASTVIGAFKTKTEFATSSKIALPQNWGNFDNFVKFWNESGIGQGFVTSIFVMFVVITLSVLMGSMLAYVLNRFSFPGNKLIRNAYLLAALVPTITMQVTIYKLMIGLNLVDTLTGYIILQTGTDVISIYIMLQYFENLSNSLDESAVLEGCTYFGVFFKILFPLLRPAIITCMILKGVAIYNEYYNANLYLQSKDQFKTVSTALYVYLGPTKSQYEMICAGVLICIIPILLIFLIFQREVYSGMTNGAVKG